MIKNVIILFGRQKVILWFLLGVLALRFHDEDHANLLNSMWLTAITFLCVGYGDIVPNTYCGRGITLTCGMVVCMTTVGHFGFTSSSKHSHSVNVIVEIVQNRPSKTLSLLNLSMYLLCLENKVRSVKVSHFMC